MQLKASPIQNNTVFSAYTPFRNSIRKLDLVSSLRAIHAHIQHMQFDQPIPPYIKNLPRGYAHTSFKLATDYLNFHIYPWELEVIAKETIIHGELVGGKRTLEDWNQLATVVNKLKALENDIAKVYSNLSNVLIEFHRIAHRQFIWQDRFGLENLAKYWKIYSDPALDQVIFKATELRVNEVYLIALLMTGTYLDKFALFYPPDIDLKPITREHLDKFLKHFSIPLEQLRDNLIQEQQMNEKYVYSFTSLKSTPIIRMKYDGKEALLCPIPPLFTRRITEGLYYEICNETNFDKAFGDAFQNFIGELLRLANKKLQIIPERIYEVPEKRTVDWIAVDSNAILFIECKGKRLTLEAKISLTNTDELYKQLDIMAGFIVQIYKTIIDYQNGKYPHLKYDKTKPIYPILVTLEEWFLFGDKLIDVLNEKITSKLQLSNIPLSVLDSHPYTICSVEGLDLLIQISRTSSLNQILKNKNSNADIKKWHLETYLRSEYKKHLPKIKPLFRNEFDRFLNSSLRTELA